MPIYYRYLPSPVGNLLCIANETGLLGIEFEQEQVTTAPKISTQNWLPIEAATGQITDIFYKTEQTLTNYFAGKSLNFTDLDFLAPQGTPFQQSAWHILRQIPYGKTTSYGEIATTLGKPNAMRAVGNAVGRNPISILIPCHRVLGKNQALTGFGGSLPAKRYLLDLEKINYQDRGVEFVNPKIKKW